MVGCFIRDPPCQRKTLGPMGFTSCLTWAWQNHRLLAYPNAGALPSDVIAQQPLAQRDGLIVHRP